MGRSRATIAQLTRVLDGSVLPIFVLDDQRQIVFWNAACAEWTGLPADAMLGQRCVYQAADAQVESVISSVARSGGTVPAAVTALASGLCPPPEVFSGHRRRLRRSCIAADGRPLNRWVEYVPLTEGGDCEAPVLALVDAAEIAAGTASAVSTAEPTAEDLHQQLVLFRRQFARRFVPDRFVGQHPAIVLAREQAALAARSGANVLIVGPTGSGKEHLARAIHYARGSDENASLLPLDCGALGGELLWSTIRAWADSEAGATTGRVSTLLLSDVDQLPAEVQPALAEFLAAKRVGIQVIGTAARALDMQGAESTLRHDLAGWLSTLVIQLPPLSARASDLPLLTQALLEGINAAGGKQVAGFTPEALDLLAGYAWPGNCDELMKLVAEAHARVGGSEIGPRDLPKRLHLAAEAALNPQRPTEAIVLEDFLARMERELIERALKRAKGNKSRAAKLLGLTRPRLYRRMVQLGLEPPAAERPAAP
jgi:DNA-binding NtrC family response regulator